VAQSAFATCLHSWRASAHCWTREHGTLPKSLRGSELSGHQCRWRLARCAFWRSGSAVLAARTQRRWLLSWTVLVMTGMVRGCRKWSRAAVMRQMSIMDIILLTVLHQQRLCGTRRSARCR
jgi:hypothetical protein